MDHFMEEVVVKKNRTMDEVAYVLSMIILVVFGLIAFITLQTMLMGGFDVMTLVICVVTAGVAALLFLFRNRLRTEYEYTFTNGDFDFAKVFNNQKRKSLGTMRVKNVDAFGPVNSDSFKRYVSMPGVKTSNWFLNRGAELYYFYFVKENNKRLIIFEPSAEMVEYVKKYVSRGAYQA